ncbi:DNA-binding transcriptional regulator, MocR family, contains an aminotransferase domain [Pseudonocardia thermophila]|uniref:DNA-binding transcriptional regulator, MocR family, contains an aminotransferase domain n=1 Tax=Pseudonocardia thermophila TaxID=1848 RepID=A0A1M6YI62_PSETH|nr:PLP-dependent aminotransferase family protein [Pseudonocardia thermophila]SHL17812.1 DNA-binding transcriptional regulator, MocR family, contains an aminotransferase domain [Pseudonocardia thermophila]
MDDFRVLADAVAADIKAGRLKPGDRLPTQRRFARERGIAVSTASRVYGELTRRGLVVGEVGRGTFVRSGDADLRRGAVEPSPRTRVDLELNFPVLPGQAQLLARSLDGMLRPESLGAGLRAPLAGGTPAARAAAAVALSRSGWTPAPECILFTGNGKQAISTAISAFVPVGGRLGVEALTYPVVRGIGQRLGVQFVPLAVDEEGVRPDAIAAAGPLSALYLQPTHHNPLGVTMSQQRREELAEVVAELDLVVIEDLINAFLAVDAPPPLAAFAPERTVVVDSLSKRLAPGLSVGYVVPPPGKVGRVAGALRAAGSLAPTFAVEATTRVINDGTLRRLEEAKRADAAVRQALVAEKLAGFAVRADPHAYYCWWELPAPWRAEMFVAAAARAGIGVTPAAAFAVGSAHAPNAVRLALAIPPLPVLGEALDTLATIARGNPGDEGGTE